MVMKEKNRLSIGDVYTYIIFILLINRVFCYVQYTSSNLYNENISPLEPTILMSFLETIILTNNNG